jgi:hypothetical protein
MTAPIRQAPGGLGARTACALGSHLRSHPRDASPWHAIVRTGMRRRYAASDSWIPDLRCASRSLSGKAGAEVPENVLPPSATFPDKRRRSRSADPGSSTRTGAGGAHLGPSRALRGRCAASESWIPDLRLAPRGLSGKGSVEGGSRAALPEPSP